jgi:hypothetical protein
MLNEEKYFETDKLVDEVLKTNLQFSLSDNFAELIAKKVERSFAWEQYLKEFLIYLSVIAGIGLVWGITMFIWKSADWKVWLDFLIVNAGLILGINFLAIFILFADRVLLRYFMFKAETGNTKY